jgi:hypothetical protein
VRRSAARTSACWATARRACPVSQACSSAMVRSSRRSTGGWNLRPAGSPQVRPKALSQGTVCLREAGSRCPMTWPFTGTPPTLAAWAEAGSRGSRSGDEPGRAIAEPSGRGWRYLARSDLIG